MCVYYVFQFFARMVTRKQSLTSIGPILGFVGNSPGLAANQIRVLTLNNGEHHDSTLYRLQKGLKFSYLLLVVSELGWKLHLPYINFITFEVIFRTPVGRLTYTYKMGNFFMIEKSWKTFFNILEMHLQTLNTLLWFIN